jgi:hypothetical protein
MTMARSRRARDLEDLPKPDSGDDLSDVVASAPSAPKPTPAIAPPPPKPVAHAAPAEPVITLSTFALRFGRNPLMRAFQDCERLSKRHTRKRTRSEWQADFDAFLKEPR